MSWATQLPPWVGDAIFSMVALLGSYLVGQFIKGVVCRKLAAVAKKTTWQWDEVVIEGIRTGIPFWSVLLGLYIAFGFWPLPDHLSHALTNILFVLVALSATLLFAGIAGKLIVLYGSTIQQALPVTSLTQHIIRIIIVTIGLLMILNGLGISIAPILTALGVGGLAVALALQDTLSNLFAGFYVTMSRQIRIGDYVKLESGEEGYVTDIGWRATKIKMLPNNVVLVPNVKLASAIITNYYLPDKELAVLVQVGVDYASDLEHVERVTVEVAREVMQTVPGGVPAFEPFIRYHTFADFSINFTVILRAKEFVDQYLLTHEFVKRLHTRYDQEGITIPFPIRTIHMQPAERSQAAPPASDSRSGQQTEVTRG
ncbi:MAG: mechanosensitive ion channel family protein [Candidatus Omnitrophota bacterium]|nr:mechanosensitive ion channel family protein [Candidatus Omnitrophota bacterium]